MAADNKTSGQERPQKRLEELLLDEGDNSPANSLSGAQDVKIVAERRGSYVITLLVLVIILLVLGLGFVFLKVRANEQIGGIQNHYFTSPKIPVPARPATVDSSDKDEKAVVSSTNIDTVEAKSSSENIVEPTPQLPTLFSVSVGPLISDDEVAQTINKLQELGFQPEITRRSEVVTMVRLLEGTYPPTVARRHVKKLKTMVTSPFLLPQGDKLSVFAGSFHQKTRAEKLRNELAAKNVVVSLVEGHIKMVGTELVVLQADQQTAKEVAAHLSGLGLKTRISEKK